MQSISLLAKNAPAALATAPRPGVSDHYSFFPTIRVLEALEDNGWSVASARQVGTRNAELVPYKKHEVILHDRQLDTASLGLNAEFPRIHLLNGHDGATSYGLSAGLYRKVCMNGLCIPDGIIQSVNIRHTRRTIEEVIEVAQSFRANADQIAEHVGSFKSREFSSSEVVEFAKQAIALRVPEDGNVVVEIQDVLKTKRNEDVGNNAWLVFNRTQQWLLGGGFLMHTLLDNKYYSRKAKAVKSIDESNKLNVALWELAENFVHGNN